MNLNQWKLGPKIYLVVALLSAVAIGIGALGADTMRVYNRRVGSAPPPSGPRCWSR